jgi:hypothetical protein
MKKIVFWVVLVFLLKGTYMSQEKTDPSREKELVKQTALDYVEGWFDGDAERMARALHPELVKRALVIRFPASGRWILSPVNAERMIEMTRAGTGKLGPDVRGIFITVYDVFDNIANVKVESSPYIDYLQLAKQDGRWRIVNVLWTQNNTPRLPLPNRFPPPATKK